MRNNRRRKNIKLEIQRRRLVAMAMAQGMTAREIKLALEAQGLVNPDTGKPYGLGTVGRDMKALSDAWRAKTVTDVNEHLAGKLQELAELKRAAWKKEQYGTVLNIIARECALLGLDSPSVSKNLNLSINADDLTDEELSIIAAGG